MSRFYQILVVALLAGLFVVALLTEAGVLEIDWKNFVLLVSIFLPLGKWAMGKLNPPENKMMDLQQRYREQEAAEFKFQKKVGERSLSKTEIEREIKRLEQLKTTAENTPKAAGISGAAG